LRRKSEFEKFANLADQLLAVPHAKIKEKLEAEKAEKKRKKAKKSSASREAV
jgi:hypothetical protein